MAHSIKNPQIIHLRINTSDITMRPIEVVTRYLCCGSYTPSKSTRDIAKVTCKNCIREIKRHVCPNCGNPTWPVSEEPRVTCPPPKARFVFTGSKEAYEAMIKARYPDKPYCTINPFHRVIKDSGCWLCLDCLTWMAPHCPKCDNKMIWLKSVGPRGDDTAWWCSRCDEWKVVLPPNTCPECGVKMGQFHKDGCKYPEPRATPPNLVLQIWAKDGHVDEWEMSDPSRPDRAFGQVDIEWIKEVISPNPPRFNPVPCAICGHLLGGHLGYGPCEMEGCKCRRYTAPVEGYSQSAPAPQPVSESAPEHPWDHDDWLRARQRKQPASGQQAAPPAPKEPSWSEQQACAEKCEGCVEEPTCWPAPAQAWPEGASCLTCQNAGCVYVGKEATPCWAWAAPAPQPVSEPPQPYIINSGTTTQWGNGMTLSQPASEPRQGVR
jgi:hypothetical protein